MKILNSRNISSLLNGVLLLILYLPLITLAQSDIESMFDLPLEELANVKVVTASGIEEEIRDVPATIVVITKQQIQRRAYTSFEELLQDLPSFDVIEAHGIVPNISYQRGHRTNFTNRTLMLVDGVIANNIWTQQALFAQQIPLTHIERVEVLYGPAGAVYGANAFQGVINIITKKADDLQDRESLVSAQLTGGSFDTKQADLSLLGRYSDFSFSAGAKVFETDGFDMSDVPDWGFVDEGRLSDRNIWGSVLDKKHNGVSYGKYHSPTRAWGFFGRFNYKNFTLGLIEWEYTNGYGLFYPFDSTQPNVDWGFKVSYRYLQHESEFMGVNVKTLFKSIDEGEGGGRTLSQIQNNGTSLLTLEDWNSESEAWKVRQDYEYHFSDSVRLQGGIKYQRNKLANNWDVCGIDVTFATCSSGAASTEVSTLAPSITNRPSTGSFPTNLIFKSSDTGGYVLGAYSLDDYRFSAAARYDDNSLYGYYFKKRGSVIKHIDDSTTVKLIYSEAFQEPSALAAYAAINEGISNPPVEEVVNNELVFMHRANSLAHEISVYRALIEDVIVQKSSGVDDIEREIWGFEYRLNYDFENIITQVDNISGYFYYTYNKSESDYTYNLNTDTWERGTSDTGDIAPHKFHLGINIPLRQKLNLNITTRYFTERELYGTNTLNQRGIESDSYALMDLGITAKLKPFTLAFRINNVFDEEYFHPGALNGDVGNDFLDNNGNFNRTGRFHNSLHPQLGRHGFVSIAVDF